MKGNKNSRSFKKYPAIKAFGPLYSCFLSLEGWAKPFKMRQKNISHKGHKEHKDLIRNCILFLCVLRVFGGNGFS